ncbi:MAG: diacylglycerol kinase [Candidatus Omnitrophota bacterium]
MHSVNDAIEGVVHTFQTERNMRMHFLLGFIALIAGVYFNLTAVEFMLLCFAVTFVLVAEMFNTAVEHAIDFISKDYHPLAKIIKDIAAGAVFVSAVNAILVGYILLIKRISGTIITGAFVLLKQSQWHITMITLLIVVGLVLLIKVLRKEKYLLKGGMPSGHSAVVFAVWVVVSMISSNALISLLVFFMAVLVAKSRMTGGVHTFGQVLAGSILGVLVTLLIFQLLS